jgi:hypothetical protein
MSVPVGPHGSLEVASHSQYPKSIEMSAFRTIANLDLNTTISLGHILDTSHDFRHGASLPVCRGVFPGVSTVDGLIRMRLEAVLVGLSVLVGDDGDGITASGRGTVSKGADRRIGN